MLANCPTRDEILAYCIGAPAAMLPEETWTKIDAHLASCPRCQVVAQEADHAAEPLLDRLRRLNDYSPPTLDPCLPMLLGRATAAADATAPKLSARPEEPLPAAIGDFRILGKLRPFRPRCKAVASAPPMLGGPCRRTGELQQFLSAQSLRNIEKREGPT